MDLFHQPEGLKVYSPGHRPGFVGHPMIHIALWGRDKRFLVLNQCPTWEREIVVPIQGTTSLRKSLTQGGALGWRMEAFQA